MLPQAFSLKAREEKTIEIKATIKSKVINEGVHQGWLTLKNDDEKYNLPYLFINKTASFPKAMGFDLKPDPFHEDQYKYQFYVADEAEKVSIHLYDPATLFHEQKLLELKDVKVGLNEGYLDKKQFTDKGNYKVVLSILLKDGTYTSAEGDVLIN